MFARHYILIVQAFLTNSIEDVESFVALTSRMIQLSSQLVADETLLTIVMVEERGLERLLLAIRLQLMRTLENCRLFLWDSTGTGAADGPAARPQQLVRPPASSRGVGRWPITAFLPFGLQCLAFADMLGESLQRRLVCLCLLNQERLIATFIELLALVQGTSIDDRYMITFWLVPNYGSCCRENEITGFSY